MTNNDSDADAKSSMARRQQRVEDEVMAKANQKCAAESGTPQVIQKTLTHVNAMMMTYRCR